MLGGFDTPKVAGAIVIGALLVLAALRGNLAPITAKIGS